MKVNQSSKWLISYSNIRIWKKKGLEWRISKALMSPKILWLYCLIQALALPVPLSIRNGTSKLSVCYFSYSGNTHIVAFNLNKFASGPRQWTFDNLWNTSETSTKSLSSLSFIKNKQKPPILISNGHKLQRN